MKKKIVTLLLTSLLWSCSNNTASTVEHKTEEQLNVVLISIDGLRWKELFNGADKALINDSAYMHNMEQIKGEFWRDDLQERREVLMPFMWQILGKSGQLYGNRAYDCNVNLANKHRFSSPGYNEMLVGYPDDVRINSNDPINNPNITVLEKINQLDEFNGKVYGSVMWAPIQNVVNETRSGIEVRGAEESLHSYMSSSFSAAFSMLGRTLGNVFSHGEMPAGDIFTEEPWFHAAVGLLDKITLNNAIDIVENEDSRVLYVAFGSPDDTAHDSNYEGYLLSIRQVDGYIKTLWDTMQAMDKYKGKTTFIITPDHGRGSNEEWPHHGANFEHADEVWSAMIGPNVVKKGEVKESCDLTLSQIASTVADVVGVTYTNEKTPAKPLPYK